MYLKKLEMQGFKSFLHRAQIEMERGITVIVGPNGTGKSNVVDAIKWCLGEASARTLRGKKMEDVIFGGSNARRPVGRGEVSLILDNSRGEFPIKFEEVAVTRRVFRSGESEFFINKVPCRLRDIQELFMDTAVGQGDWTIFRQGKVDEILHSRSDEKRLMLEEAAGLVKFRNRKKEALRKLEESERHLERVQDILYELEGQLVPLKKEADIADMFLKYNSELKELDLTLSVRKYRSLLQRLGEIANKRQELDTCLSLQEKMRASQSTEVENMRGKLINYDDEISSWQEKLYSIINHLEVNTSKIGALEEKRTYFEERMVTLEKEMGANREKLSQIDKKVAEEKENVKKLQKLIREQETLLIKIKDKNSGLREELATVRQQWDNLKGRLINSKNKISFLNNKIKENEGQKGALDRRKKHLNDESQAIQAEIRDLLKNIKEGRTKFEELVLILEKLSKRQEQFISRLQQEERRGKFCREKLEENQDKLRRIVSRLKLMEEMAQSHEGYFEGVKIVLRGRDEGVPDCLGICDVVARLLHVAPVYEKAIEVVLGPALQNVVTETAEGARKAICYLKVGNRGRVTFLPLDALRPRYLRVDKHQLGQAEGFIGVASKLVEFEQRYLPVVRYLLGDILIFKTLESALAFARRTNYRVKIVSLDGDVIHPGGSLTGGTYQRRGPNLLGRSREIEELEEQRNKQLAEVAEARENLLSTEAKIGSIKEELDRLQTIGKEREYELKNLEADLARQGKEKERLDKRHQIISSEIQNLEKESDLQQREYQKSKLELENELARVRSLEKEISSLEEAVRKAEDSLLEADGELTSVKVEQASLNRGKIHSEDIKRRLEEEYRESWNIFQEHEQEKLNIKQKIEDIEKEIEKFKVEAKQLQEEKRSIEVVLMVADQERKSLRQKYENYEKQVAMTGGEVNNIRNQLQACQLTETKLKVEVQMASDRIEERHGLSPEEVQDGLFSKASTKEIRERMIEIEKKIIDLGPVNRGAIEEYKRLNERHNFLTNQKKDLVDARFAIKEVIREVDAVIEKRFLETFHSLSQVFQDYFKELFGGGRADLRLTDPDNLLETGVELAAQPPGKKLQEISLLSGGEKTLTVIALIFSILKIKTCPFCILDEVDASLDDANVDRFAAFLKRLAPHTQFIVITHRQRTMETADVLYGITMEEPGISKVVSVRMNEISEVS